MQVCDGKYTAADVFQKDAQWSASEDVGFPTIRLPFGGVLASGVIISVVRPLVNSWILFIIDVFWALGMTPLWTVNGRGQDPIYPKP